MTEQYKQHSKRLRVYTKRTSPMHTRKDSCSSLEAYLKDTPSKKESCTIFRSKQDRPVWYATENGINMQCKLTVGDVLFLQKRTRNYTEYMKLYFVRKFIGGNAWSINAEARYKAILEFDCVEYLKPRHEEH